MPEKFNIVRQCRHGLMVFNRHDQFIGKALKVYGEYSEGEYDVFSQVVKPGDTVIEAGANLGAHTLGLAQLPWLQALLLTPQPPQAQPPLAAPAPATPRWA